MFAPGSKWKLPVLSKLPSWKKAKRVAIDVETCDPQIKKLGPGVRRDGFVCGVAFAIEDGPAAYLPVRHEQGGNLDPKKVFAYLRRQAKAFRGKGTVIGGANLSYDLDYLLEEGVAFEPEFFRDAQVAEPLIDELQNRYALDVIAERYQIPGKKEGLLHRAAEAYGFHPKQELWRLPPKYVGAYAERDVRLPLELLRRQERKIDDDDLWGIYDLESRLLPVLVRMRRRGVRISHDQLDRVERWSLGEERKALGEIKRLTGVAIAVGDVWKAAVVAPVLTSCGVEVPKTPSTQQPSVKDDFLKALAEIPAAALIRRARKVNKVRTTFVESIRRHEVNGRIHCTLKQLRGSDRDDNDGGARYGRLSSTDPNLQQQPARDPEIGPMWRAVYRPEDGELWACLDYSQQEPRWLTHYAYLSRCRGAVEAVKRYQENPRTDNHRMMTRLIHGVKAWDGWGKKDRKYHRDRAKQVFLAKCYGMGGAKLCRTLGLPTEWTTHRATGRDIEVAGPEGQALIRHFDESVPYVKQLSYLCEKKAARVGFLFTVLGRRCRFPKLPNGGYDWTYKALNRLVQGTSADQTKAAMVAADAEGFELRLAVHDEVDLSVPSVEETAPLAKIMREVIPCVVPHIVDVETGPDWGHIS